MRYTNPHTHSLTDSLHLRYLFVVCVRLRTVVSLSEPSVDGIATPGRLQDAVGVPEQVRAERRMRSGRLRHERRRTVLGTHEFPEPGASQHDHWSFRRHSVSS